MSVELRPLGVKCNIQCQYCYQNPQRDAGNILHAYNLSAMKTAIEREGGPFTLFGGEPLMVPEADLEELWRWGLEKFGGNGIQTNGSLINENHIRMFKKFKVHVGISVDGPGELNDVRWAGSIEKTREATARSHAAIERLCREGIPPSIIVTLHRCNGSPAALPKLQAWFKYLEGIGVTSARLHVLEIDSESVRAKYGLSTEENLEAFLSFAQFENDELTTLKLDVFQDMKNLLLGTDNNTTCIWNACDPSTTRAVRGVEGNGQTSNCGRTNKDGIDFVKSDVEGFERYLALYHTPQDFGGCHGCRYFLMCKGQCPGTAIEGDWRNRTEHCQMWMTLFDHLEGQLIAEGNTPISRRPDLNEITNVFLDSWAGGRNINIAGALAMMDRKENGRGENFGHGDVPHGDSHGDHTDYGARNRLSTLHVHD